MAKGTTNKFVLKLPSDGNMSVDERIAIERFSGQLPLAAHGFHVYSTTNEAVGFAGGNYLALNTFLYDKENWRSTTVISGANADFVVPKQSAGLYVVAGGAFYSPASNLISLAVMVNDVAVTSSQLTQTSDNRVFCTGTVILNAGDRLNLYLLNDTAATNITSTATAATATLQRVPFMSAWRIAVI